MEAQLSARMVPLGISRLVVTAAVGMYGVL